VPAVRAISRRTDRVARIHSVATSCWKPLPPASSSSTASTCRRVAAPSSSVASRASAGSLMLRRFEVPARQQAAPDLLGDLGRIVVPPLDAAPDQVEVPGGRRVAPEHPGRQGAPLRRDLHLVGARGSRLPGAGRRPAVPADPLARSARAGGSKTRGADLVRSDLVYGHESFLPPTASASEPANFSASAFARGSRYEITSSRRGGAGDASTSPLRYRRADGL